MIRIPRDAADVLSAGSHTGDFVLGLLMKLLKSPSRRSIVGGMTITDWSGDSKAAQFGLYPIVKFIVTRDDPTNGLKVRYRVTVQSVD